MYSRTRRYSEDDEDVAINSELIWTFNDVDKDLLKAYPNGKALSERLVSIGGLYTWRVEFYPNGRDHRTYGNIVVAVSLEGMKGYDRKPVEAECTFSLVNKMKRQNYSGKIERRRYELNGPSFDDSSFENSILKECYPFYPLQIVVGVTQYPYSSNNSLQYASQLTKSVGNLSQLTSSASPSYSNNSSSPTHQQQHYNYNSGNQPQYKLEKMGLAGHKEEQLFDEDDFRKKNVNFLYNKYSRKF